MISLLGTFASGRRAYRPAAHAHSRVGRQPRFAELLPSVRPAVGDHRPPRDHAIALGPRPTTLFTHRGKCDDSAVKRCPICVRPFPKEERFCSVHGLPLVEERLEIGDKVGDLSGQVLDHRYRLAGVAGQGGMGVVYEAENLRISRRCASIRPTSRSSGSSSP